MVAYILKDLNGSDTLKIEQRTHRPSLYIAICHKDYHGHYITDIDCYEIVDNKIVSVDHKKWLVREQS